MQLIMDLQILEASLHPGCQMSSHHPENGCLERRFLTSLYPGDNRC